MNKVLQDIYWVYWREMKKFMRQRSRIAVSIIQPTVWLVLMGNNLAGLTRNPEAMQMLGTGNYLTFMTPGIMVMTALFSGTFGGTSIVWDRRLGFLNKMLAAPISRASIPLGKMLSLIVQSWLQVFVILCVAFLMGVRIVTGIPGVIFMIAMASLFEIIMGGISLSLSARIKSIETLFAIMNFLTLPLMFTSNAIFPVTAMPEWLRSIAAVNPLSYAVGPMRVVATQGWHWDQIWVGVVVLTALAAISIVVTVRQFRTSVA